MALPNDVAPTTDICPPTNELILPLSLLLVLEEGAVEEGR
jgi:hypothetical protein